MDPARFDARSRVCSRRQSRRTALAAFLAGPLTLHGRTEAAARHKKKNPCTHQPNDASCTGNGRCLSGVCNPRPNCLPFLADCTTNPGGCCGHLCCHESGGSGECLGGTLQAGEARQVNADCASGLACLGYVCQSTNCGPASDACVDQTLVSGNGGLCLRPSRGGDTRCGAFTPTTSRGCTSNRQCSKRFGRGAFCATFRRNRKTFCECEGKSSFCAVPA